MPHDKSVTKAVSMDIKERTNQKMAVSIVLLYIHYSITSISSYLC